MLIWNENLNKKGEMKMVSAIIGTALGFVLGTIVMGAVAIICWKPLMLLFMRKTIELMKDEDLMKMFTETSAAACGIDE